MKPIDLRKALTEELSFYYLNAYSVLILENMELKGE
jgi:hypothetical protein